jgi:SAM-dependent methyltransferase
LSADRNHHIHDYVRYDYTGSEASECANQPEHSLEIGFSGTAQSEYLLKRFEDAAGSRVRFSVKVLDVGCGPADFLAALKTTHRQCEVQGLDPSEINVRTAWQRHKIRVRQAFWEDPHTDTYDVISIFGNLMLHKNPLTSLRLAHDRLTDGGLLVFDFKNPSSATRSLLRAVKPLIGDYRQACRLYRQAFHGMPWGLPQRLIEHTLNKIGFEIVSTRQLSGRNAALSGKQSMLLRASAMIDRLSRRQAWIEFVARKPARHRSPMRQAAVRAAAAAGLMPRLHDRLETPQRPRAAYWC